MSKAKFWSAVVLVLLLAASADYLQTPVAGATLNNPRIQFEKIGFSNYIFIDDNQAFTSPIILTPPYIAYFTPGMYYWKGSGLSPTRNFTLQSEVAITIKQANTTTIVENTGNVPVQVTGNFLTGATIIDWGNKARIENATGELLAQQHE
ncbi:MAG: hypothetical protein Q7R96_05965 [Nanoarchaeota archaeon]|nr:hypothetical protein [Nanoarchaeota archaeon]